MSNRTALGGYDVQSGSHIAPGARCELNVIQLAGATPFRLRPRLHGPEARTTMRNSTSMQAGSNLSPGLFASVVAGSHGEEMTPHLFSSSRSALKLAQAAQTMLDIAALGFVALFIILLFASPFIAAFCMVLLSF